MGNSKLVYSLFLFFISFSCSFSSNHTCPDEQRDALLVFKQNISSINPSYVHYDTYRYCNDRYRNDPIIRMNWNTSIDCCDWDGITCNNFTRDVISLDVKCGMLKGVAELDILLSSLPKLEAVDLSYSGLSVVIRNDVHYVNPDFYELGLASCNLNMFPDFLRDMKNLQILDLSNNKISGDIPDWVGEIGENNLTYLDLSDNSITDSPELRSDELQYLYLKSNLIQGPFPPWICNRKHLKYLDISNNGITGPFPKPICNMGTLLYLDMSNNSFHGELPECFGNITSSLAMINLGENKFHGTIPKVYGYCGLVDALILNGNKLEGEVPNSLAKCQSLKILDLGNNQLNGRFPSWLEDLPKLQVLILTSNNLHGTIEASSISVLPFSSLKVFDISNNAFVGHLPGKYFESFNAIKDVDRGLNTGRFDSIGFHYYYIYLTVKGVRMRIPTLTILITAIDLSSNRFEGEIPSVIGNLKSLNALNLSNNNLNGQIPYALGNLVGMESLDISRNQLVGEIPQILTNLSFLAILNLSQNYLVGRIPEGNSFDTFEENSYYGNPGLCGPPLPRRIHCKHLSSPQDEAKGGEYWIYMKPAMLGLGCGTLLGAMLGYRMLSTGRPKWFNAIADVGGNTRRKKRKHPIHIRKRN